MSARQVEWAYAYGRPGGGALVKGECSDFRVDEELGFVPGGEGEHLMLHLRKVGMSTTEAARRLSEITGVKLGDIGYGGMKDKRAESSQWFSLRLADNDGESMVARLQAVGNDNLQVLEVQRNSRKLRIGAHRGNRFQIRLREVSGAREEWERRLQQVKAGGVPNYFGQQRFGPEYQNIHQVSRAFAAIDASNAKGGRETQKTRGAGETQEAQEARGAQETQGEQETQQKQESRGNARLRRGMLYSAARAYLFNEVLSARITQGTWNRYLPGDVLALDGSRGYFLLAAKEDWDDTLQQRLDSFDIHLTGPLAGQVKEGARYTVSGEAADSENAVLAHFPQLVAALQQHGLAADRRPLRVAVKDLQWHWEGQDSLNLGFFLPRGSYATSVLREICNTRQGSP